MAEPRDEALPEGWHVPQRLPTLVAIVTPLVLLALLLTAGRLYQRRLRPMREAAVHSFPAPGVESYVHGGAKEPRVRAIPPRTDPAIARAADAVVAHGLPGWSAR